MTVQMWKRTMWAVLALAFVAGAFQYAAAQGGEEGGLFWSEQWCEDVKHPTDWLSWGLDARLRALYDKNISGLNDSDIGNERVWQRYRTRVWATMTPMEDVEVNARLMWEFRNYCRPESMQDTDFDEALFDRLNVSWKNALDYPATLTVGRQDIIFGNGWLVLEGTPLDDSRTIFFDAARLNYQLDEWDTTVDLIYIDQASASDRWLKPFNDRERGLTEQDERGAILYVTNNSLENTQWEAYYIWKHDMVPDVRPNANNFPADWSNESDIHTVGARVAGECQENWKYRAEFAQQMGKKNGNTLCAFGFNSQVSYLLQDELNNSFRLGYEYLSGDDPGTGTDEQFDPLWARYARWSELYVYTYALEGRIAETTNLHRVAAGWSCQPHQKLELAVDYHLLFADQNTQKGNAGFSDSDSYRGQLATALLKYHYTKHLCGHLLGEFFCPGNYYADGKDDLAMFLRYELMLTF